MTQFAQAVVNGIGLAAVYSLIALGFVIIYKSMQVLSFAQPGLMLFSAYWVVYFSSVWDFSFWLALVLGAVLAALTGVVIERGFLRPMIGKPVFAIAIMTIGIDLILRVTAADLLGVNIRPVGDPWGIDVATLFGSVTLPHSRIAAIVTAFLVMALLAVFFKFSRHGLAMRATAFDQEAAMTQGVSIGTVFALSWAIAAVLAMLAGVFLGSGFGLTTSASVSALKALPIVVIGGLDSIVGAVVASLLVGIAEQLTVTYQPQYAEFLGRGFSQVVPYVVMFLVLLVRPYGLFGTKEVERV